MSLKSKLTKAFLLVALTCCFAGVPLPITHKEIEEIQRAMNQQTIEIVVPIRNGTDDPK
jgi:hypothetical protein